MPAGRAERNPSWPTPQADTGGAQTPPWERDGEEFDPQKARTLIQHLRDDNAKLKAANETSGARLREIEDAKLAEHERLERDLKEARKRLAAVNTAKAWAEARAKYPQLTERDFDLIGAGTPEDVIAKAAKLAARIPAQNPDAAAAGTAGQAGRRPAGPGSLHDRGRPEKRGLAPHLKVYWAIPPGADAAFAAAMEDVLAVYARPYDPGPAGGRHGQPQHPRRPQPLPRVRGGQGVPPRATPRDPSHARARLLAQHRRDRAVMPLASVSGPQDRRPRHPQPGNSPHGRRPPTMPNARSTGISPPKTPEPNSATYTPTFKPDKVLGRTHRARSGTDVGNADISET